MNHSPKSFFIAVKIDVKPRAFELKWKYISYDGMTLWYIIGELDIIMKVTCL